MKQLLFSKDLNPKYFIRDTGMPMNLEDYSIEFACEDKPPKGRVLYDPHIGPFGPVLIASGKAVAYAGCRLEDDILECTQIQGARGAYKELTPLNWDCALLDSAISLTKKLGLDAITMRRVQDIEGVDYKRINRLIRRYDHNAQKLGFKFSKELGLYVKEIK